MSLLIVTLDKEELPVDGGKEVVHDDVHPGAILPELEVEDASIALPFKSLQFVFVKDFEKAQRYAPGPWAPTC